MADRSFELPANRWQLGSAIPIFWLRSQPAGEHGSFEPFGLAGDIANVKSVKIDVTCVYEPRSWAMVIIGFGAMGGAQRRRRSIAAA